MLTELIDEKRKDLSTGQIKVADYIIKNPRDAAFLTASQIGKKAGVSESTVIRFAIVLGFSGFPALKDSIRRLLVDHLSTLERYQRYDIDNEKVPLFEHVINEGIKTLALTRTQLDHKAIGKLSSAVANADGLYIIGQRSSYTLAYYLSYYLSWFIPNTHTLDMHLANERLSVAPDNSLVLAVSFPRFSRWTLDTLVFAKRRGIKTASITNAHNSPLALYSDIVFAVPWNPLSFIDSFTAPLCIMNCIILDVSRKLGSGVNERLRELEEIWKDTGAYVTT